MKGIMRNKIVRLIVSRALVPALFILGSELTNARAQGTAFTYQGHLNDGASPANGNYDLRFTIYDAVTNGNVISGPLTNAPTGVTNGVFTVTLDFGDGVFTGPGRWLDIGVRTNGSVAAYSTLSPRQSLTAVPYAITAGTAVSLAAPPGMIIIPAGPFTMGDTLDGETDAVPATVTVSAFYMDVNLVSLSQWQSVYYWATNHGYGFTDVGLGRAANQPVQTVDWYDTVKWCNARSQQAGLTPVYYTDAGFTHLYTNGQVAVFANWTNDGYRLPTEAEWEKAARGGLAGQRFPWGNVITENLANYFGDTVDYKYDLGPTNYNAVFTNGVMPYTSPVGYFAPNSYGLYDMAGNVLEWCWDYYASTPYPAGSPYLGGTDPRGPASGSVRVLRGGDWFDYADWSRCCFRYIYGTPSFAYYSYGFRCVKEP
jgi:formylglycine-generating enzyme required for sulfatase activity